jgi:hypothetical protein
MTCVKAGPQSCEPSRRKEFWGYYEKLPHEVRVQADKCFALLKTDSYHPSLHFKKVGNIWSARIGIHYRALAVQDNGDFVWIWIGRHDEYDALVGRS